MTFSAVILAAGRGERFGGRINKVLYPLGGRPLLEWSLRAFLEAGVDEIVVVGRPAELAEVERLVRGVAQGARLVPGGARRQDSSLAGVEAARGEYVLVHDAARPLVTPELIQRVYREAMRAQAAIPAIPVVDTVRYLDGEDAVAAGELAREGLVRVQTPQGFLRELLLSALRRANEQGLRITDDAAAVLALGRRVAVVPGDPYNLKITRFEDLRLAEALLGLVRPGR